MKLCRAARAVREGFHAIDIKTSMEDSPATDFQFELWGQIATRTTGLPTSGGAFRSIF